MGKKMKIFSLLKPSQTTATSAAPSWPPWPACVINPKTNSFRANTNTSNDIYKTMNSAYLHDHKHTITEFGEIPADSHEDHNEESFSSASETSIVDDEEFAVIRGLRSDRLFFEPDETSSIFEAVNCAVSKGTNRDVEFLHMTSDSQSKRVSARQPDPAQGSELRPSQYVRKEGKKLDDSPYKGSVAIMAIDSTDPFVDFKVSMEEMVEAHGFEDWECLEELLACYLRVNCKSNHGYILGAFIDLLVNRALVSTSNDHSCIDESCSSSSTTQGSLTSPLSFSCSTFSSASTPCFSSSVNVDEIPVGKNVAGSSSSSSCIM